MALPPPHLPPPPSPGLTYWGSSAAHGCGRKPFAGINGSPGLLHVTASSRSDSTHQSWTSSRDSNKQGTSTPRRLTRFRLWFEMETRWNMRRSSSAHNFKSESLHLAPAVWLHFCDLVVVTEAYCVCLKILNRFQLLNRCSFPCFIELLRIVISAYISSCISTVTCVQHPFEFKSCFSVMGVRYLDYRVRSARFLGHFRRLMRFVQALEENQIYLFICKFMGWHYMLFFLYQFCLPY